VAHGKYGVRRVVADGNMHLVSAARLIALKREETKVRPVAVGEIFRRLRVQEHTGSGAAQCRW